MSEPMIQESLERIEEQSIARDRRIEEILTMRMDISSKNFSDWIRKLEADRKAADERLAAERKESEARLERERKEAKSTRNWLIATFAAVILSSAGIFVSILIANGFSAY